MKKVALTLLPFLIVAIGIAQYGETIKDYCTYKESRVKVKKKLAPFTYDAQKLSKFTFKAKEQTKEIEIPLFMGENYRIIFCQEGMPQPVSIQVYNKQSSSKKRVLLWSNEKKPTDKEYIWEPEKSKKMYLNYTVPATNDTIKKGCVFFVLGYASKFKK